VSSADNKVVILGETGTGKELVARAIHFNSKRKDKRFGIVNCNHKTTELVEAELFGYKKGAFSGAFTDRKGLFEVANGGTVFLDEIGDLSSTTQNTLLRVLETGEFQQIGPEADVKVTDVRVICATHRNLVELVKSSQFREDLFYRLKGTTITLPPLRDRREDIALLIDKIKDAFTIEQGLSYKAFAPDAINLLIEYDWPGNVRQLKDTVESLIVLTDSELIVVGDVVKYLHSLTSTGNAETRNLSAQLKKLERTLIIQALVETNYNISAAAEVLELERSNLSKKIKSHCIDIKILREE
jgi:transcriptional regulator with GAF, ATPase, and Fis domain